MYHEYNGPVHEILCLNFLSLQIVLGAIQLWNYDVHSLWTKGRWKGVRLWWMPRCHPVFFSYKEDDVFVPEFCCWAK